MSEKLVKLYFGVDRKLTEKASVAAGISANIFIYDSKSGVYKSGFSNFAPYSISEFKFNNGYEMKFWIGAKFALRFF